LVNWSFVELVEEKWPHCYGDKFTKISTKEKNCVILNVILWKKINFVHQELVYTETRRKQQLPNIWSKNFPLFFETDYSNK